jgi:hypothetical protein
MVDTVYIYIIFKGFVYGDFLFIEVLFVYIEIIYLIYFYINKGDWEQTLVLYLSFIHYL